MKRPKKVSTKKVAIVFPGQGAQAPGMCLELANAYPATAGEVFRVADRVLGFSLSRIIALGDQRLLARTDITQPALVAAGLSAWRALQAVSPQLVPVCAAGLSLGEYTALAAAGALDLTDVFRLVSWRGRYMEEAARRNGGSMTAVLGLPRAKVEECCAEAVACGSGRVWVTNYNAPGQNVIAGEEPALANASERVLAGGGRVIPLKVRGAFHSPFMVSAQDQLAPLLATMAWRRHRFPVYANTTARPYLDDDSARNLATQVTSPVLWEDTVRAMSESGVDIYLELGPGKTLASLITRIVPGAVVTGVSDPASLAKALELVGDYALEGVS